MKIAGIKRDQIFFEDVRVGSEVPPLVKPPVTVEDLQTDTEHDPAGAEEFVSLIRSLRRAVPRPVTL